MQLDEEVVVEMVEEVAGGPPSGLACRRSIVLNKPVNDGQAAVQFSRIQCDRPIITVIIIRGHERGARANIPGRIPRLDPPTQHLSRAQGCRGNGCGPHTPRSRNHAHHGVGAKHGAVEQRHIRDGMDCPRHQGSNGERWTPRSPGRPCHT